MAVLVDLCWFNKRPTLLSCCFLSFLLPVPLVPSQAVRLSHFLQGQWHRMQSKPCTSLRPWRYCIICPFFLVFFVQMRGGGNALLFYSPLRIVHMATTDSASASPLAAHFTPLSVPSSSGPSWDTPLSPPRPFSLPHSFPLSPAFSFSLPPTPSSPLSFP